MEVGGLRVASITDRIDGPSNWTIERDVHALILYEAGGYHWLETWLGDMRTSLGDPLPGEMWLVPAGLVYRAAAKGGAVRYSEVEIPVPLLSIAPHTRALAAHHDLALAALVRAVAAGDASAAGPLVAILARTLDHMRSEEHTSELQSLMRISYAVFCLKKQTKQHNTTNAVSFPKETENKK